MEAFTLYSFNVSEHQVELVLPEAWQAKLLFEQLQKNHNQFVKWLKWANNVDSPEKEADSIKMFQQKMIDGIAFNLTILVDHNPAGMIDLHHLNNKSGEMGYWLSGDYQHLGIMTKCVKLLSKYAFEQLNLDYLLLRARSQNYASQHVAENSNFKYLKTENDFKVYILKNNR